MFKLSHLERVVFFSLLGAVALGSIVYMVKILLTPLPEILPPPIPEREVRREVIPEPVAIPEPEILPEPEIITKPPSEPTPEMPPAPKEITIRITGAVKRPGVYQFEEGARVVDAVKAAGVGKGAILNIMRLAQPLEHGSEIVISRKFDAQAFRKRLLSYGPAHIYTTEELILAYGRPKEEERRKEEKPKEEEEKPKPSEEEKININTAMKEEFQTLPGIGPKKAEAFIRYREEHGPFQETSDIMKIHGIGQKTYENLKDKITVD